MTYTKQIWRDRVTEHPSRRNVRIVEEGTDGVLTVEAERAQGTVYDEGTPLSAERLNHMEDGIAEAQEKLSADNRLPYAYLSGAPASLPNPYPLYFGNKAYNGQGMQFLTVSDLGLGTVFRLKGSKASASDLPASDNTIGDVWYVIAEHVGYVWLNDGTARWEQLGLPIDLSGYAETDGSYPDMEVGHADHADYAEESGDAAYADQLDSTVALTVSSPFVFRPSGGGADVEGYLGSKAEITAVYGNTIVWNQMVNNGNFDSAVPQAWEKASTVAFADHIATFTAVQNPAGEENAGMLRQGLTGMVEGHKYLLHFEFKKTGTKSFRVSYHMGSTVNNQLFNTTAAVPNFVKKEIVFTASNIPAQSNNRGLRFSGVTSNPFEPGTGYSVKNCFLIDLTVMFGAGNEPASADEFRAMFPLPYYAYAEGRLLNFTGTGIRTAGFNVLAPDGMAHLLGGNAYEIVGAYMALSYSTGETITPVDGIFTPSADGILTVTGHDGTTCVHLVWSGYRDGEYEPYWSETKTLPVSTYFPDGMKSVGTVKDELTKDKAVKRCGIRAYQSGDEDDSTVITDGTDTVYALPESVETPIDPPLDLSLRSADYGTELLLPENTSVPATTPMYADIDYTQNLRDKLQRLPMSPRENGLYLVKYAAPLQEYLRLPDFPAEEGDYVLKCTVGAEGAAFAWDTEDDGNAG